MDMIAPLPVTFKAVKAPTLANVLKRLRQGEAIKVLIERSDLNPETLSIATLDFNLFIESIVVRTDDIVVYGISNVGKGARFGLVYSKKLPSQRITGEVINLN